MDNARTRKTHLKKVRSYRTDPIRNGVSERYPAVIARGHTEMKQASSYVLLEKVGCIAKHETHEERWAYVSAFGKVSNSLRFPGELSLVRRRSIEHQH